MLRSAYETQMRFSRDPAAPLCWVTWYFVDGPDPKPLPYENSFNSANQWYERYDWDGLGETTKDWDQRPWYNGKAPHPPGIAGWPCGTGDQWKNGVVWPWTPEVLLPNGTPACCNVQRTLLSWAIGLTSRETQIGYVGFSFGLSSVLNQAGFAVAFSSTVLHREDFVGFGVGLSSLSGVTSLGFGVGLHGGGFDVTQAGFAVTFASIDPDFDAVSFCVGLSSHSGVTSIGFGVGLSSREYETLGFGVGLSSTNAPDAIGFGVGLSSGGNISTGCYVPGIPTTVNAAFTATLNCGNVTAVNCPLTYDGISKWIGTFNGNFTGIYTVTLTCGGVGVTGWNLDVEPTGLGIPYNTNADPSSTNSPLNLLFVFGPDVASQFVCLTLHLASGFNVVIT